jgi:5-methylcytosine-specific restriction endonuclease McrA
MMPRARPPRPKDERAERCLRQAELDGTGWKQFRSHDCGKRWWNHLASAYDFRCIYCDHSPARTIDHYEPKSRAKNRSEYDWDNWRAACGDCNRLKARRRPFDPTHEDPITGLGFSPDTGKPFVRPMCPRSARSRAQASLALGLDNETLNDARRRVVHGFLLLLSNYLENRASSTEVLGYLKAPNVGNRAILRDMILEHHLFYDGIIVETVLERIPEMRVWANAPLGAGSVGRLRRISGRSSAGRRARAR